MHHFRKKSSSAATPTNTPPPTPTQPVVEYIKRELATSHRRAKDWRVLAASSSAVALSISSPSCDPSDIALSEPGSSKESIWKAAYGAARIAVDIAKDSSDMLPPLKAVMVALSVLMKNCDVGLPQHLALLTPNHFLQQTVANVEQIRELEERIQSLRGVLTFPVSEQDNEEKARRGVLRRFVLTPFGKMSPFQIVSFFRRKLAGIIAKLGPLSEQHGLMKFFKNVDHANTLNGFVNELAYAIIDYQACYTDRFGGAI